MNYVGSNNLSLNIKGLHHQVVNILELQNLSLWQKLNSFANKMRREIKEKTKSEINIIVSV